MAELGRCRGPLATPEWTPMTSPEMMPDDDGGLQVRRLLRAADRGALATMLPDGTPYASLVLLALDLDAAPLLLLSDLAEHSKNITRDQRVLPLVRRHRRAR